MTKGPGASTTGNIYGIYDMSGGSPEYLMGVFTNSDGALWSGKDTSSNSGFTGKVGTSGTDYTGISFPNSKYYDIYKASNGTTINENTACNGEICYGYANAETNGWYKDSGSFISADYPWTVASGGGHYDTNGIFSIGHGVGYSGEISFRIVFANISQ